MSRFSASLRVEGRSIFCSTVTTQTSARDLQTASNPIDVANARLHVWVDEVAGDANVLGCFALVAGQHPNLETMTRKKKLTRPRLMRQTLMPASRNCSITSGTSSYARQHQHGEPEETAKNARAQTAELRTLIHLQAVFERRRAEHAHASCALNLLERGADAAALLALAFKTVQLSSERSKQPS